MDFAFEHNYERPMKSKAAGVKAGVLPNDERGSGSSAEAEPRWNWFDAVNAWRGSNWWIATTGLTLAP